ncbi:hypothetical protein M378DRAFT_165475 [Amanita muscaria Koide BX008]|uniref:Uncharacterized protein n=1 Tax=Amanita muscaria (strain Koide BX008) TaxID=946122 RepID=A0A0C2T7R0_AMAMK|nr:hypothetical protein M378DRAFT_165475 [Amanita muscaria Koide BX008]
MLGFSLSSWLTETDYVTEKLNLKPSSLAVRSFPNKLRLPSPEDPTRKSNEYESPALVPSRIQTSPSPSEV